MKRHFLFGLCTLAACGILLAGCGSVKEVTTPSALEADVSAVGEGEDLAAEAEPIPEEVEEELAAAGLSEEELAAAAEEARANAAALSTYYENVPYASNSEDQVMNISLPEGEGPFPVIVAIHGGGFSMNDQNDQIMQMIVDSAVAHGYAAVSMDYRKLDEASFPGALADVRGAVRFLRAHAEEYRLDTGNISLWGQSAGAYLAATTALTPDAWTLNSDVTDNLEQSCAVNSFVDYSGPISFNEVSEDFHAAGMYPEEPTDLQIFLAAYLGFDPATDQTRANESYWATYVDQLPPGFDIKAFISHGTGDWVVPYTQSVNFAERLKTVLPAEHIHLELYEGGEHESTVYYEPVNLEKVFQFLQQ